MTRRIAWMLALVPVLAACGVARAGAEPGVRWGAEMRYRPETRRVLLLGTDVAAQQFLRTRITLDATPEREPRLALRLGVQDARTLGTGGSGAPAGDANLGVHEAFMRFTGAFHPALAVQLGRFEMKYGNERFIGAGNWSNTGQRHEGVRVSLRQPSWQLDLFRTKILERLVAHPSRGDRDLYGAWLSHAARWDAFLLYDYDGAETLNPGDADLARFTLGMHSSREFAGSLDYTANVALQGGSMGGTDLSAWLLALEVGLRHAERGGWRVAAGVDIASGDDPGDADFQGYNNLYYTGHRFRGFMDQFVASNAQGLVDLYGRVSLEPAANWRAGADLHIFRFAQDPGPGNDERSVGMELDVTALSTRIAALATELGAAMFVPSEDQFGDAADTEVWAYLQVSATLP